MLGGVVAKSEDALEGGAEEGLMGGRTIVTLADPDGAGVELPGGETEMLMVMEPDTEIDPEADAAISVGFKNTANRIQNARFTILWDHPNSLYGYTQPANRKPTPKAPRWALASAMRPSPSTFLDGSNLSEALSTAHQAIVDAIPACLNAAGTIANLIKNIEDLDAVLPTTIAEGTNKDEIHRVLTTVHSLDEESKTLPHLPSPAALILFLRRTRNAATQMGVCI
ncbi:hypothetical protein DFH08DRAFT_803259 [Mycena albidolilacea]|uniref:Uncharacterized protein n=1 Tax=Mycena albidolilacea TaxID=1033008 RepID=A0AAD7ACJ6_9AGAR|nr:hypothetical protein DFH08DRAFT_803259 [Mycena albidolilacea]